MNQAGDSTGGGGSGESAECFSTSWSSSSSLNGRSHFNHHDPESAAVAAAAMGMSYKASKHRAVCDVDESELLDARSKIVKAHSDMVINPLLKYSYQSYFYVVWSFIKGFKIDI